MNLLLFSDLHITANDLVECKNILSEITSLVKSCSIAHVINLGDTFDITRPGADELDLFASFIKDINIPITIIAAQSHESETSTKNILKHYGILSNQVTVVNEYQDGTNLFCGHFILTESIVNYGAKRSQEEFKNIKHVVLGHQHTHQIIRPNICHLGSCRFVNFDEAQDTKVVAFIEGYRTESEKWSFIRLKSPYPMQIIELCKNIKKSDLSGIENKKKTPNCSTKVAKSMDEIVNILEKLPELTKVKVKIGDFDLFKEYINVEQKYHNKFTKYLRETDFENIIINSSIPKEKSNNINDSLARFLKEKNIDPEVQKILKEKI